MGAKQFLGVISLDKIVLIQSLEYNNNFLSTLSVDLKTSLFYYFLG